jgi:hypothetical protein
VRAPNVRPTTKRREPLSTQARERFRAWVARHIVADDPHDGEDLQPVGKQERTPFWMGIGLALMLLSAFITITGLMMLWRWIAG